MFHARSSFSVNVAASMVCMYVYCVIECVINSIAGGVIKIIQLSLLISNLGV